VRLEERRTLIVVALAGVAGAILILPALYFLGLWLAPPRPVPATAHVPKLVGEAIWARAEGGRATELQPVNPISFVRMRVCRAMAARTDDLTLRGARRAECMKLLPAIQAVDYLSGVHMQDSNAATGGFREGLSHVATAAWMTRSWTKTELLDTIAERGDFGFGWRGVDAASRGYFGREVSSLSLPDAALLAASVGDPHNDPWCNPAEALGRRRRILERMRDNDAIDRAAFEIAAQSEIGLGDPPSNHTPCSQ
jgi:hypothetical protein